MIVPWKEIPEDTLINLIKEFILREGTDYGEVEASLEDKIQQVLQSLKNNKAMIVYSELHETVDIKPIV